MNRAKSLLTLLLMGVPVWLVLFSVVKFEPSRLTVYVDEPGVTVWVGDLAIPSPSKTLGPFEVRPGDYRVRVTRDGLPVFNRMVQIEPGVQSEVWAHWRSHAGSVAVPREVPPLNDGTARVLEGHWATVTGVGFTADGGRLVTTGAEGVLRTWDANSGAVGHRVEAHVGPVAGLAVLADGRRAVTSGDDLALRVWDLTTGAELASYETGSPSPVRCVAASPDGRLAAIGTESGLVHTFDLKSGRVRYRGNVTPATPSCLAFSPDGKTLLVGLVGASQDREQPVLVWDADDGRELGRLDGHRGPVWGVAFSPDGARALSVGTDATLRVWDLAGRKALNVLADHPGAVFAVAVSRDGRYALTGTGHRWEDGWQTADAYGVQLWDLKAARAVGRFDTRGPIRSVAFSPDGHRALAGGEDRSVRTWKLPDPL